MLFLKPVLRRGFRLAHASRRQRQLLTQSYVEGPLQPPLCSDTLPKYFRDKVLEKHSLRPALVCRSERPDIHGGPRHSRSKSQTYLAWDFEEFNKHINAFARGLLIMGVQKGDRVGVIMGNNSAYAILQWACASIGAILVTINPAYRLNELTSTLFLVGVEHLFVVPRIRTSHYLEMFAEAFPDLRHSTPGVIQESSLPELRNLVVFDNTGDLNSELERLELRSAIDWREVIAWQESIRETRLQAEIFQSLSNEDVINLQFTSGTTGAPKAVSLTHSNLLNNALLIARCMRLSELDVMFHLYSTALISVEYLYCHYLVLTTFRYARLVLGNLAAWSQGACIVYPSEIFSPPAIVDAVVQEQCTALHGVPTHFLGVLAEVERRQQEGEYLDFSRLRTGIAAGSPIPIELMKQLIHKLNLVGLTNAYGMTETSPVSFQTVPEDPIIKRVETVGRVHPHVKAKVIDTEGNIVPIGTPGEICVSGYLVQKGYWNDEQQTRSVTHSDGSTVWMHTGDEGIMDDEGYLRIVGRKKDIIIRGGENLFPVQIENALTTNPAIREAAVVAVPDPKYGEVVGAWIVRQLDMNISREEVRKTVADIMNPQNAPAWVWFVGEGEVSDELPKTASGKVMKHILRDWSRDLAKRSVGRVRT